MRFEIEFSEEFLIDIKKHQKAGNKILLQKIDLPLTEIRETPVKGTGKSEQLKYFKGLLIWSIKINVKHRLVYEIKENSIEMLSGWGYYDDK